MVPTREAPTLSPPSTFRSALWGWKLILYVLGFAFEFLNDPEQGALSRLLHPSLPPRGRHGGLQWPHVAGGIG